jgi:hypothetical protein
MEIAEPPQAQPITVQTAKPRAIINPSPRQNAIAKSVKRQLTYRLEAGPVRFSAKILNISQNSHQNSHSREKKKTAFGGRFVNYLFY